MTISSDSPLPWFSVLRSLNSPELGEPRDTCAPACDLLICWNNVATSNSWSKNLGMNQINVGLVWFKISSVWRPWVLKGSNNIEIWQAMTMKHQIDPCIRSCFMLYIYIGSIAKKKKTCSVSVAKARPFLGRCLRFNCPVQVRAGAFVDLIDALPKFTKHIPISNYIMPSRIVKSGCSKKCSPFWYISNCKRIISVWSRAIGNHDFDVCQAISDANKAEKLQGCCHLLLLLILLLLLWSNNSAWICAWRLLFKVFMSNRIILGRDLIQSRMPSSNLHPHVSHHSESISR